MEFNYKVKNIELEVGLELLTETITRGNKTEIVTLDNALGLILRTDIYAKYNNPPFNRSAVDGFALISDELTQYKIIGELCAGDATVFSVKKGECVRIMTGAEIPHDCDCCVRQEDVIINGDIISLNKDTRKYENYVFVGEDYKQGELLLQKGTRLTFIEIGILASAGYYEVEVYSKPKIALISTGDEVMMPNDALKKSKIYNSNIYLLDGRLKELGLTAEYKKHLSDDANIIYNVIQKLSNDYDFIITTGGVSVGKKDIFHDVVQYDGMELVFWRLNIQPGTPIMCSKYNDTPIISLSGNPFASLVNFELVVREALYTLYNDSKLKTINTEAIIESDFNKKSKNRRFIRAYYENGKVFINTTLHSSGVLSSLQNCNCLIEIKPNTQFLSKGDKVQVVLL